MAWLGKISNLGNLSDIAGAVNKFSESVKNIERNFDSSFGFEARSEAASEAPPASAPAPAPAAALASATATATAAPGSERQGQPTEPPVAPVIQTKDGLENGNSQGEPSILNNVFGFARANLPSFEKAQSHVTQPPATASVAPPSHKEESVGEVDSAPVITPELLSSNEADTADTNSQEAHDEAKTTKNLSEAVSAKESAEKEPAQPPPQTVSLTRREGEAQEHEVGISAGNETVEQFPSTSDGGSVDEIKKHQVDVPAGEAIIQEEEPGSVEAPDNVQEQSVAVPDQHIVDERPEAEAPEDVKGPEGGILNVSGAEAQLAPDITVKEAYVIEDDGTEQEKENTVVPVPDSAVDPDTKSAQAEEIVRAAVPSEVPNGPAAPQSNGPDATVAVESFEPKEETIEVNQLKTDLKSMEAALHGAAKQSQMKADEISRLMVENEDLKSALEELKNKANSVELDALREEYQQRVGAAERKVYALTKERDMLRREQSRKSDSSILLKEKDEIIKQVMAEGEELSKKQAVQEGTMRKLRAQIRELEEEKQRLNSKLQVEEGKVESIRKDKAVTETALQEAVEKGQTEIASLRDYYTAALNEAKESEARAEARADSEAKADLERRLREAADREVALLRNLDDLRQALSQTEQQAAFREDMRRRDLEDLEKRCQAAETRYEELVTNMPDSTKPLRQQIEALQESSAMRADAWSGVERSLNSRLQAAEAKAAAAQERERAIGERLSQTLSRVAVMEAQLSMLRAEQSQLSRSLEKERQRASESRQEYLAATEMATTLEGRAKQIEEEFEESRIRHKQELKEERARRHALEQEIDQEKALIADYEKRLRADGRSVMDKGGAPHPGLQSEFSSSHKTHRRMASVSSAGSVEENFTQTSTDSEGTAMPPRLSFSDRPPSPFVRGPGASFEQLEGQLRQKEGELNSYFQRLTALESTRDSLAEELVRASTQCEALRTEAAYLPGLRAELDSLRRRHTSALELMGERDEEVEELKADLADIKQMYREQITMLVGQIERLSSTMASR